MSETVAKMKAQPRDGQTEKTCMKCGRTQPLDRFFSNKGWVEQGGLDLYCKDCYNFCKTKEDVRAYFWENHRYFKEDVWKIATEEAERLAVNNRTFQKLDETRKASAIEQMAVKELSKLMNRKENYEYFDPMKAGLPYSYKEAKKAGHIIEEDPDKKEYNAKFNGHFKASEVAYLEKYYNRLANEFDVTDIATDDIAKKMAKASLIADRAQDDFNCGRCSITDVRDALAQYDLLSKSGNFAACKRKAADDSNKQGSFGELVAYLETHGRPCIKKIEWEPDDVDKCIEELRHIVAALDV